jgi:hypothetical protein
MHAWSRPLLAGGWQWTRQLLFIPCHARPCCAVLCSYHEGDPADSRMTATARSRGVTLTSRSRPLTPTDLAEVRWGQGREQIRGAGGLCSSKCTLQATAGGAHSSTLAQHPVRHLPPPHTHALRPPPTCPARV